MPPRAAADDQTAAVARSALAEAAGLQQLGDYHGQAEEEVHRRKRHLWLRANRGGITYNEIAEECGVSRSLVDAGLARARAEEEAGEAPRL